MSAHNVDPMTFIWGPGGVREFARCRHQLLLSKRKIIKWFSSLSSTDRKKCGWLLKRKISNPTKSITRLSF